MIEVLKECGGNNSTNETMRAGKPFHTVPFGAEQVANARRSVVLGGARALVPAKLKPGGGRGTI